MFLEKRKYKKPDKNNIIQKVGKICIDIWNFHWKAETRFIGDCSSPEGGIWKS